MIAENVKRFTGRDYKNLDTAHKAVRIWMGLEEPKKSLIQRLLK